MRHEFNSRCYSEFMSGNDGPFTELELQLKETIGERSTVYIKLSNFFMFESSKIT